MCRKDARIRGVSRGTIYGVTSQGGINWGHESSRSSSNIRLILIGRELQKKGDTQFTYKVLDFMSAYLIEIYQKIIGKVVLIQTTDKHENSLNIK